MQSIASFLSASLFDTGLYTVIDSSQRDAILKELQFSATDCTDESCQLEIGKLLAAELIVIGDIGKVGTRFMLTAKMLETETSRTISTAKGIYGSLDDLLDDMNAFAARLAGAKVAQAKKQPAPQREPRQPIRGKTVAAWSSLGAGLVAGGVGGYLFYDAASFRSSVLEPSYALYKTDTADFGGLTAAQYYDGLWNAYAGNVTSFRGKAIVATAVAAGGAVLLGGSLVLFLLPESTPATQVSFLLAPAPLGAYIGLGIRF
jgi:hypothetical protein